MKISIQTKLLLPLLLIFLVTGLSLNWLIVSQITKSGISTSYIITGEFVKKQAAMHLEPSDFIPESKEKTSEIFRSFFREIGIPEIVRIKVWDKNGMILYSDSPEIIGQNFKNNINFKNAINGKVDVAIKKPVGAENVAEMGYKQLIEIYVPIVFDNQKPLGVIETYYSADFLNAEISRTKDVIALYLSIIFFFSYFLTYLLIRYVIVAPIRKLKKAANNIAMGNMKSKITFRSGDEIGDFSETLDKMRCNLDIVMQEYEKTVDKKLKKKK